MAARLACTIIKKARIVVVSLLLAIVIVACFFSITWAISGYLDRQFAQLHDGCYPSKINHIIIIKNNRVFPGNTVGYRCENITITNVDDQSRTMAFGLHADHVRYDGISEQVLQKGQSFTITLIQTGKFIVHDHDQLDVTATFTVQ